MLTPYHYGMIILLMMTGLYIVIAQDNLIRKLIGLNLLQVSVFVLYISLGYLRGGTAPVLAAEHTAYASPLPHVLILTAIVVGISTMAVGLALVVRIYQAFGTIKESELRARQRGR